MSDTYPFLSLEGSCEETVVWVIQQMSRVGLSVVRTFDLKVARLTHTDCPCPHHGTEQCDCQIVVLLVYGSNSHPISIVAHCHEGRTMFSLVDNPHQRADPVLEATIRRVLVPQSLSRFDAVDLSHAT